mmetsp:Transcript_465/g.1491  ORF Transcript_465/g.1491 Transcript_465/m.1491 type:complete len:263 (+) Transcript_465:1273-2061(+)
MRARSISIASLIAAARVSSSVAGAKRGWSPTDASTNANPLRLITTGSSSATARALAYDIVSKASTSASSSSIVRVFVSLDDFMFTLEPKHPHPAETSASASSTRCSTTSASRARSIGGKSRAFLADIDDARVPSLVIARCRAEDPRAKRVDVDVDARAPTVVSSPRAPARGAPASLAPSLASSPCSRAVARAMRRSCARVVVVVVVVSRRLASICACNRALNRDGDAASDAAGDDDDVPGARCATARAQGASSRRGMVLARR